MAARIRRPARPLTQRTLVDPAEQRQKSAGETFDDLKSACDINQAVPQEAIREVEQLQAKKKLPCSVLSCRSRVERAPNRCPVAVAEFS